jgi:hypothetical protein
VAKTCKELDKIQTKYASGAGGGAQGGWKVWADSAGANTRTTLIRQSASNYVKLYQLAEGERRSGARG